MSLLKRYRRVREAEKRKKNQPKERIELDELDDFLADAGDSLEAEVAAELARKKRQK